MICSLVLLSLTTMSWAAGDVRSQRAVEELAAYFRAMPEYTVTFTVAGADFGAAGSYAVEGDRYYMRVGAAEAYSDGTAKWEVDPAKREIVIDAVDVSSRNLLGNPTRAFDFLGDAFRGELQSERDGVRRLRLVPTDRGAAMSAVTVDVAADGAPRALSYDFDGDTVRIEIGRIVPSADVKRFDAGAYPGYEVIDFR